MQLFLEVEYDKMLDVWRAGEEVIPFVVNDGVRLEQSGDVSGLQLLKHHAQRYFGAFLAQRAHQFRQV